MRIAIGQFAQETNTFSKERLSFEQLMPSGWVEPDTLIESLRGTGSYLGGAIAALEEFSDVEIVPIHSTPVLASPAMTPQCLEYMLDTVCTDLAACGPLDGLFLAMHGGGWADGHDDLESYILERIRKTVGTLPIMSSLDMHCNITPEMLKLSDGLFPIKEFPHVDMYDAAYLGAKTLAQMLHGGPRPVMTWASIPQIYPNTMICTYMDPMKSIKNHFAQVCKDEGFIDASVCQGFSGCDTYWSGASVLVTAYREARAETEALAQYLWDRRVLFEPRRLTAEEALEKAIRDVGSGYAVVNESTDNPGSGCPGDGTHLLRALIEKNPPRSVFMHMLDPEVVQQAHAAGVGAKITVRLGGKTHPICGEPLLLYDAEIMNLSNGWFRCTSPLNRGVLICLGLSCRLRYKNVDIVVVSVREQSYDDRSLLMTGADILDYKLVCLKSAGHFRGYFQERADAIVPAETPGLRPSDLKQYPYREIRRPIFPLDGDIPDFTPNVIVKELL